MRRINTVELREDPASPTGLAAMLGAGGTWGAVLRAIPTSRHCPPLSLVSSYSLLIGPHPRSKTLLEVSSIVS